MLRVSIGTGRSVAAVTVAIVESISGNVGLVVAVLSIVALWVDGFARKRRHDTLKIEEPKIFARKDFIFIRKSLGSGKTELGAIQTNFGLKETENSGRWKINS